VINLFRQHAPSHTQIFKDDALVGHGCSQYIAVVLCQQLAVVVAGVEDHRIPRSGSFLALDGAGDDVRRFARYGAWQVLDAITPVIPFACRSPRSWNDKIPTITPAISAIKICTKM
jgi:hypothetical protein